MRSASISGRAVSVSQRSAPVYARVARVDVLTWRRLRGGRSGPSSRRTSSSTRCAGARSLARYSQYAPVYGGVDAIYGGCAAVRGRAASVYSDSAPVHPAFHVHPAHFPRCRANTSTLPPKIFGFHRTFSRWRVRWSSANASANSRAPAP
eukprot:2779784-Rhodomonas_salina.5